MLENLVHRVLVYRTFAYIRVTKFILFYTFGIRLGK